MNDRPDPQPSIEDYATIESYCDGVPVYSFSNIAYIYGVSPDLLPGVVMQESNTNPVVKIKPKKSWEIKHNLCGSQHENEVKSAWNDSQPFLPIHLIDGEPDTVWSSWGCAVPDGRPEWIRIDLSVETAVASVALVCSESFSARYAPFGKALPKEVEIKLSCDAWHWETVYETRDFSGDESGVTVIEFQPRPVKQIWIKANNFPDKAAWAGHVFSIAAVEVRDPAGQNLALVSRGASVTVSSVTSSHDNDRFTQDALWGPLQYDLGNKWVRIGPDNGIYTWYFVEHEKGKLEIDPRADEAVTEAFQNGVNIIMVLDFKGNWIYMDPPRKTNWKEARFREINNGYDDGPGIANVNPEMHEAYLRYVDYMVRLFKDRVVYFEIGNEWNGLGVEQYMKDFFEPTYATIKKADPDARVMLGNPAGFEKDLILECLGPPWEIGPRIDALGWHPGDNPDGAYFDAAREFKKKCEALGFKGHYFATEIYAGSVYPPGPQSGWPYAPALSEIGMAKYLVRSLAIHSALDMEAGPCHPHFTGFQHPQALCAPVLPAETVNPCRPTPSYYAWRTMATVLDDFYATEFPVSLTGDQEFISLTFESGDKKELMLAAWFSTPESDDVIEARSDITLPGVEAAHAWVVDIFNGTEQELNITFNGKDTVLEGMLIKDYPTFVRLTYSHN